jgi:hypothetical protein
MSFRPASSGVLLSLLLGAALGCSNQPAAPTDVDSPSAAGQAAAAPSPASGPSAAVSASRFGDRVPGVVYVTSQNLYYDTFATADPLPMKGKFQLLTADGMTEFGPGQPGYLGGRWWVDVNGNSLQDAEDRFFLCPLLPPGRPTP